MQSREVLARQSTGIVGAQSVAVGESAHCVGAEALLLAAHRQALRWIVVDEGLLAVLERQPRDEHAQLESATGVGVECEPLGLGGGEEVAGVARPLADQQVLAQELDLVDADEQQILDGDFERELGAVPGLRAVLADLGARAELGAGAVFDLELVGVARAKASEPDKLCELRKGEYYKFGFDGQPEVSVKYSCQFIICS